MAYTWEKFIEEARKYAADRNKNIKSRLRYAGGGWTGDPYWEPVENDLPLKAALEDARVQEALASLPSYIDPFKIITSVRSPVFKVELPTLKSYTPPPFTADKLLERIKEAVSGPATDLGRYIVSSSFDPNAQYKVQSWQDALDRGVLITDPNMRKILTDKLAQEPYYKKYPEKLEEDVMRAQTELFLKNKDALSAHGALQAFNTESSRLLGSRIPAAALFDVLGASSQNFLRESAAKAGFQDIVSSLPPITIPQPQPIPFTPTFNAIGVSYGAPNPYLQQMPQQQTPQQQASQQQPLTADRRDPFSYFGGRGATLGSLLLQQTSQQPMFAAAFNPYLQQTPQKTSFVGMFNPYLQQMAPYNYARVPFMMPFNYPRFPMLSWPSMLLSGANMPYNRSMFM